MEDYNKKWNKYLNEAHPEKIHQGKQKTSITRRIKAPKSVYKVTANTYRSPHPWAGTTSYKIANTQGGGELFVKPEDMDALQGAIWDLHVDLKDLLKGE